MQQTNQQWILHSRPKGTLSTDNFALETAAMPEPDYAAGEVLVKNLYIAFDARIGEDHFVADFFEAKGHVRR